ncbi:hypothetical protein [Ornithinimicrobium murale]|uniref:hypothetical protein n=1 Tax=Ornithinimicrobium murale TaxID=1050153 RepID=UPI000E0E059E|nr:hypothetical protein [Ornithinimicrobium murale]
MRRLHLRRLGTAALLVLALTGCGDQTTGNPAPSDPAPTTSSDTAPTTADGTTSDTPTSAEAEDTHDTDPVTDADPTTSAPTTEDPSPTSETAGPAPTSTDQPPATPASGECTDDSLSSDILGFTGGVRVDYCDDGWASAVYPEAPGAPAFIAETSNGRWFHAVSIGDPVCAEDLAARGAPSSITDLLPGCGAAPGPTTAPPTPTGPDGPCTIQTALYGATDAELVGVSCDEATAEWQVAEANTEPSWKIPGVTPSGWECYVTPYEKTSAAAGSCYGPDGSAYFTLYVP